MSKPRRFAARLGKADENQAAIKQALEAVGCGVAVTSAVGRGFPDLVVARVQPGGVPTLYLVEVKVARGKLRESQADFQRRFPYPVSVIRSVDEALELVGVPPMRERER